MSPACHGVFETTKPSTAHGLRLRDYLTVRMRLATEPSSFVGARGFEPLTSSASRKAGEPL